MNAYRFDNFLEWVNWAVYGKYKRRVFFRRPLRVLRYFWMRSNPARAQQDNVRPPHPPRA